MKLAGVDAYEADWAGIWAMVMAQSASLREELYWEIEDQTAGPCGPWKLGLNAVLVEGAPQRSVLGGGVCAGDERRDRRGVGMGNRNC